MKKRDENVMFDLILNTAKEDPNIRVVILEGSRANPNAKKDQFSDFDIVYGVNDLAPYRNNLEWIKRFGELMIMQMPDGMFGEVAPEHKVTYLMQFVDGNRIDLNVWLVDRLKGGNVSSLSKVLLDKDGAFDLPPPSEKDYFPKPPTEKEFSDCCNEFWWVVPYVAKGLARGELGYARWHLEHVLREQVMKMLDWEFGVRTGFGRSAGKFGKNYGEIGTEIPELISQSYTAGNAKEILTSMWLLTQIFRKVGQGIAGRFGFRYPGEEDRRVVEYLGRYPVSGEG